MSCIVYVGCKMTGRDRAEMVDRAKLVCRVLKDYGLTPISPVIEEHVARRPGPLTNASPDKLRPLWSRDKYIIRRIAHVTLFDHGEDKSFGMEREYSLNRGTLWKPTVLLLTKPFLSVANFEDDYVATDLHEAAAFIRANFGTRWKRWKWRAAMLNRSLPRWLMDQVWAWR